MKRNLILKLFAIVGLLSSCSEDNVREVTLKPYDPGLPTKITTFMPDSGGIATQVIINGSNFGTDNTKLRVYFNKKRATVVKTIGDLAYVLAPKLPGDTCKISVVIGNDSLVYDKEFYYKKQVIVSTISGTNQDGATVDGTLSEARFYKPYYLVVDKEKNIMIGEFTFRARLLNEEKNSVTTLLNVNSSGSVVSGCTDAKNEVIYFPVYSQPYYFEFDPEKQWTPRRVSPTKVNPKDEYDFGGKYSLAMCHVDSMLYTITTNGELIKINPKAKTTELVMEGILKEEVPGELQTYLCFHPTEKNMLYFVNPSSMAPNDGPIVGTDKIYRINLNNLRIEEYAGSGIKGHEDGPKDLAQFNNPCQICFDKDGVMYVGDTDNYCVRSISTDGIVSTVVGIPGTKGYLDGSPDVALFDRFWGMKIDEDGTLYIADYYNYCIRKLTIE
ncbi:MAG: IPT/TIG domain-containing protein [Bacteroidales bacterium]|nr:IPT/TIG domain-containing protein [Bacteroidales bacterium]